MSFRRILLVATILGTLFITTVPTKIIAAPGNDTLLGYWKLDGSFGDSTAIDSSGDGNNASLSSSFLWHTGKFGNGVAFNASEHASTSIAWPSSGTLSFWVAPSINADWASPAGWKTDPAVSTNGYCLVDVGNSSKWRAVFRPNNGGAAEATITSIDDITSGWHHLAMTWNLSSGTYTIKFYVDGALQGTTTWTGSPGSGGLGNFNFGKSGDYNDNFYQGWLDEIKVYSRALSQTEITALADGSSGVPHTTATWTANSSGDWEESGNWDIHAVPDPYTKIIIPPAPIQATLTQEESLAGLTINANGLFDLAGYNLTMNDSGTFTNNGGIEFYGSETLTNITPDTTHGFVRYEGTGTYNSLNYGSTYHSVYFDGTGTYTLSAPLTVGSDFELGSGTLDANGKDITISGNWTRNGGTFTPSGNTVKLIGSDQQITGSNTFYNLTKQSNGFTLTFDQGSTTTITNATTLNGVALGVELALRSSSAGTAFKIDPQGTRNISYVDIKDSNNINAAPIAYSSTNVYRTNINNWLTSPVTPTPTATPSHNNSSSTSSAPSNSVPTCTLVPYAPDLFQINTTKNTATLFFTPVSDATNYQIAYGFDPFSPIYSVMTNQGRSTGVLSYTVNYLPSNTVLSFTVSSKNNCGQGNGSNTMQIKTNGAIYYKNISFRTPSTNSVIKNAVLGVTSPKLEPVTKNILKPVVSQSPKPTISKPVSAPKKSCFLFVCW